MKKELVYSIAFAMMIFIVIIIVSKYLDNMRNISYVEKGLEQCVENPDDKFTRIIWVRDCEKYITTIRGEKK